MAGFIVVTEYDGTDRVRPIVGTAWDEADGRYRVGQLYQAGCVRTTLYVAEYDGWTEWYSPIYSIDANGPVEGKEARS